MILQVRFAERGGFPQHHGWSSTRKKPHHQDRPSSYPSTHGFNQNIHRKGRCVIGGEWIGGSIGKPVRLRPKNNPNALDLHDLHLNTNRHLEGNHMSQPSYKDKHMAKQANQKKLSRDYTRSMKNHFCVFQTHRIHVWSIYLHLP